MSRFFKFLSDSLLFCACCIFLASILNPFLTATYHFSRWGNLPVIRDWTITYWTYMASFPKTGAIVFLNSYWFSNSDPALTAFTDIPRILIATFFLQILTLSFGFLSLLKRRKIRIISFILSVIVVFLMIQIYIRASDVGVGPKTYQFGYWLTYPSIFLFLSALIFDLYSYREKIPHVLTQ